MFFNQLPDSQSHHLIEKVAVDAAHLSGLLRGSQYDTGTCSIAVSDIGTLEEARITARSVALGEQYDSTDGSIIELEITDSIHGLTLPTTQTVEGVKLTNRDGRVLDELQSSFMITTLVTAATEPDHIQFIVSNAQRQLEDLSEDFYYSYLPSRAIWLVITPEQMLDS